MEPETATVQKLTSKWRGLKHSHGGERGICIYEISPWPPIKNMRNSVRLVAQNLTYEDADRILKAVDGEWA